MSKAMLKLVCWLYFQVLAVMYFLPWFQVTFWEGAQTMRKSTKHAHLHDIHEVWLSRYGSTTHGPPLVCFYFHCVLEMLGRSWKNPRKSINFFNAVCTLLFCFGIQLTIQKQKKSQWRSMIGWDIELLLFFLQRRRAKCKQLWRNWLCLMNLPMKNIYVCIYTYALWPETHEVTKLNHMQKQCTLIVPCSV